MSLIGNIADLKWDYDPEVAAKTGSPIRINTPHLELRIVVLKPGQFLVDLIGHGSEIWILLTVNVLVDLLEQRPQIIGRRVDGLPMLLGNARTPGDLRKPFENQIGLV